ncbi:MAG: TetR/AcrR family transcriptional regulator [Proteobacteria bacterium]|nr:TetR/AcrR family transcriptional regulator [Desulfobacula sp.]MBU3950863.1 TetR/AcrR family transcriptional regulator [Pseudomonadota bacterium]MBU4130680.1 TetR/AcrR family transcriptional regulator [Pseudomonadota bacterium]
MKKELKKDQILGAAGIVFSQKGFHQAKMDEIAVLAKVAKGTLYYNFSSKSELFAATVTQGLNRIMAQIKAELESDLPFMAHLKGLISSIVRLYISHSEVSRIYANEMSSGIDDKVLVEIKGVRKEFIRFIENILKTGEEKGYLRPLPHYLSALAAVGIIDTLCAAHLEDPDKGSVEQIIETVYTILSTGLVANPSGKSHIK